MLSSHAVSEFASALGGASPNLTDAASLKAELGLRTDYQALEHDVTDLRAALAALARRMGT
jgi:hypothetical protein